MGNRPMGGDPGGFRQEIEKRLRSAGFAAVGFAKAERVRPEAVREHDEWLERGMAAEMGYMSNHSQIRKDPRLLLPGAETIICLAYDYTPEQKRDPQLPMISSYALLPDYHEFLRDLVRSSGVSEILGREGKNWRICVDSAPIMERYWAERAGIGMRGRNGMLIVPGVGSRVFLAEILTDIAFEPSPGAATAECDRCGACLKACPTGALQPDGKIDCNRCLSYLTIEHRGEWNAGPQLDAMHTPQGRNTLFGCDRCLRACPHNCEEAAAAPPNRPGTLQGILTLTARDILGESPEKLKARIKGSCLKRAKSDGLARNASNIAEVSQ